MKVYIVQNNKKIEPFFLDIGEILIKNKKLNSLQKDIFLDFGLEPILIKNLSEINDYSEYITTRDDVFFEPEILNNFIEESRKLKNKNINFSRLTDKIK